MGRRSVDADAVVKLVSKSLSIKINVIKFKAAIGKGRPVVLKKINGIYKRVKPSSMPRNFILISADSFHSLVCENKVISGNVHKLLKQKGYEVTGRKNKTYEVGKDKKKVSLSMFCF